MKEIRERFEEANKSLEYYLDILVNDETFKQKRAKSDVMKLLTIHNLKNILYECQEINAQIIEMSQMVLLLKNVNQLQDICRSEIVKLIGTEYEEI